MKKDDIKDDATTAYRAQVSYGRHTKVVVLEKGLARYGRDKATGVRVRTLLPVKIYRDESPVGTEFVIASRDVEREWTAEDQAKADEAAARLARMRGLVERLGEVGIEAEIASLQGGNVQSSVRVTASGVLFDFEAIEKLIDSVPDGQGAAFA